MITPILIALLGLQQSNAQLEQQTNQLSQDVRRLESQVEGVKSTVDQLRSTVSNELRPYCSAQVRWQQPVFPGRADAQSPIGVSLMSMVSMPQEVCLDAELRITANYQDRSGQVICSGSVGLLQRTAVQNTYFEFRPFLLEYFAKWRDAPTWEQSNFHRLICYDHEGIEVRDPVSRASTVKLFATVFPKRGGLATDELQIEIPRLPVANPGLIPRNLPNF